jgi:hypothetical protein
MRKKNIQRQCKIILHCQIIATIFSLKSPHFFNLKWKFEAFLLIVCVKLICTDRACSINSERICKQTISNAIRLFDIPLTNTENI